MASLTDGLWRDWGFTSGMWMSASRLIVESAQEAQLSIFLFHSHHDPVLVKRIINHFAGFDLLSM
jgi:hypothetical protein